MISPIDPGANLVPLSESQRTYLRFVAQGMTSKQIAQSVSGSHHTVNAEIGIAMRLLGAKSRHEAAAIVSRADGLRSYEPSYEPSVLADPTTRQAVSNDDEGVSAQEGRAWPLPVWTRTRPINTLTVGQRIGWVLTIAVFVVLLLGGLVSGVAALLVSLERII